MTALQQLSAPQLSPKQLSPKQLAPKQLAPKQLPAKQLDTVTGMYEYTEESCAEELCTEHICTEEACTEEACTEDTENNCTDKKNTDGLHATLVAQCPPQTQYVNGGQMCTICASMLCMAMASGLFPEDAVTFQNKQILSSMLHYIMQHASFLQTQWLNDHQNTNTQRQIMEVVHFIQANDRMQFWQTGPMKECFGTIDASHGKKSDWVQPFMQQQKISSQPAFHEDNEHILVCELHTLLDTHMHVGDTLALTFRGHTICIQKRRQEQGHWYVFDSMSGNLVHVENCRKSEDLLQFCNIKVPKSENLKDSDCCYSGIICSQNSSAAYSHSKNSPTLSIDTDIPQK
jgi:hypothetical protein